MAGAATELLFLCDFNIRECDGCHVCWKTGTCAKKDDMAGLYPKVIESDVIVFGTPVYWYGPTALMKGFIDRFVYFNCDRNDRVRGKRGVVGLPSRMKTGNRGGLLKFFEKSLATWICNTRAGSSSRRHVRGGSPNGKTPLGGVPPRGIAGRAP